MQRALRYVDISPMLFVGGVVMVSAAAAALWISSLVGKLLVIATVGLAVAAAVFRLGNSLR